MCGVYLSGPGKCEIALDDFKPSRIVVLEKSAQELGMEEPEGLFSQMVVHFWIYPVGLGVVLRLVSLRDVARPAEKAKHYLEIKGDRWEVSWMVREDFAESLQALGG